VTGPGSGGRLERPEPRYGYDDAGREVVPAVTLLALVLGPFGAAVAWGFAGSAGTGADALVMIVSSALLAGMWRTGGVEQLPRRRGTDRR
jgi:hypothetical protein